MGVESARFFKKRNGYLRLRESTCQGCGIRRQLLMTKTVVRITLSRDDTEFIMQIYTIDKKTLLEVCRTVRNQGVDCI